MAYRKPEPSPPAPLSLPRPTGSFLVRANGSVCRCTPPGFFARWWYKIGDGDRWYCEHGGCWIGWIGWVSNGVCVFRWICPPDDSRTNALMP